MKPENLLELVSQLSPEEQSAVKDFISFLRERRGKSLQSPFLMAIDEFIKSHPELLRQLAR